MTRCPHCQRANAETNAQCSHCGTALVLTKQPWFQLGEWLDGPTARTAALAALGLVLVRVATENRFVIAAANREELALGVMFGVLGIGFGLGVGLLRKDFKMLAAWAFLGLCGGLLSYSLDYFYNYQHDVYSWVWWFVYLFFPSNDNRAGEMAFGVLQVLRQFGSSFLLVMAACWSQRRAPLLLKAAVFWLASMAQVFLIRGALLQFSISWDFAVEFCLYFIAVFLLFYGLARLDGNTAK